MVATNGEGAWPRRKWSEDTMPLIRHPETREKDRGNIQSLKQSDSNFFRHVSKLFSHGPLPDDREICSLEISSSLRRRKRERCWHEWFPSTISRSALALSLLQVPMNRDDGGKYW